MPVNLYTSFWALFAIVSIAGLFWCPKIKTTWTFIADRTHLVLFIIAAMFGMRQRYEIAIMIIVMSMLVMWANYSNYKCQYLCKHNQGK